MIKSGCIKDFMKTIICLQMMMMMAMSPVTLHADLGGESKVMPYNPLGGPSYPINQNSYFTDDYGNILMFVNVIGMAGRQGQIVVRENIDFANLLAIVGGINSETNLKKVLVVRSQPEESGKQIYIVDLKPFYKKGDRTNFIALKPNDTIIFPEKGVSLNKIAKVLSITYPVFSLYNIINN